MLCARPSGEVVAALSDQLEREVRAEAVDLGEVLSKQRKKRRADIEVRPVRFPVSAPTWRWQRTGVTTTTDAQFLQHGFDPGVAGRCLLLVYVVQSECLL